jgi:hypothetical protein
MTNYIVYSKYTNNHFEENIDEDIYKNLFQSKGILFEARSKENIYNIVLMNYYEFEKELYEISLKDEIFQSDYLTISEYVSKVEQRVLNLLSSTTLYLESFRFEQDIKKYPEYLKSEYQNIENYYKNARSDSKIKIMKCIRNHIQHNGLLNPNAIFSGVNLSDEIREQTLQFEINKNEIKAKWFKSENFTDIEDKVDLKKNIRNYVDYVSQVHQKFREETDVKAQNARGNFEEIFEKYSEHQFLYAAKTIDGQKIDEIALLLNWDNTRIEMIKKNSVPTSFIRHSINTK